MPPSPLQHVPMSPPYAPPPTPPPRPHLVGSDAVGDGRLHAVPCHLGHHQVGETIEKLGEKGDEGDLQLRVLQGGERHNKHTGGQ